MSLKDATLTTGRQSWMDRQTPHVLSCQEVSLLVGKYGYQRSGRGEGGKTESRQWRVQSVSAKEKGPLLSCGVVG